MKKVTIEITPKGWELKLHLDGMEAVEKGVLNERGHATHYGDDFADLPWIDDEVYDALDSFFCFDVANALCTGEEEY